MEHLTVAEIVRVVCGVNRDPEHEGHVAVCEKCFAIYRLLRDLETCVAVVSESVRKDDCPEEYLVCATVSGEMKGNGAGEILEHVAACDYCAGVAASYLKYIESRDQFAIPEDWVNSAVSRISSTPVSVSEAVVSEGKHSFWKWLESLYTIVKKPAFAYAVAVVFLGVTLIAVYWRPYGVVKLKGSEVLTAKRGAGGEMSFAGRLVLRDRSRISIEVLKKAIAFRWKLPIKRGTYRFSLVDRETRTIVADIENLKAPVAFVERDLVEPEKLYMWIVEGKGGDGRSLELSGEFVLVR